MHRIFPFLLIIPCLALIKLSIDTNWIIVLIYFTLISALTFGAYWKDKKRAQKDGWRISEKTLHMIEAAGGWPAAYLAQQKLRHKTQKKSYRLVYWLIVGLYQYITLDYLLDWRILSATRNFF
ncbi:MAG: DUF1294 domain-containing protein [Verrucomicrobiota bacterium]